MKTKRRSWGRKGKKKTSIYDVYEPSELERGHFTERDSEIRVTDMPERFQVRRLSCDVLSFLLLWSLLPPYFYPSLDSINPCATYGGG